MPTPFAQITFPATVEVTVERDGVDAKGRPVYTIQLNADLTDIGWGDGDREPSHDDTGLSTEEALTVIRSAALPCGLQATLRVV